jgi:hypothetical protein
LPEVGDILKLGALPCDYEMVEQYLHALQQEEDGHSYSEDENPEAENPLDGDLEENSDPSYGGIPHLFQT